jgi:hypothetical protein
MHLYDCRAARFIPEATSSQIADILRRVVWSGRCRRRPNWGRLE